MSLRIPLFFKIVTWFLLNLALLGLGFLFVFRANVGFDNVLSSSAKPAVMAIAKVVSQELNSQPAMSWDNVLKRFDNAYNMHFGLFYNEGKQIAGQRLPLPPRVLEGMRNAVGRHDRPPPPPLPPEGERPPFGPQPPLEDIAHLPSDAPMFVTSTENPLGYWAGVGIPVFDPLEGIPMPVTLILNSPSLAWGGPFFDAKPWLTAGFGAVLLSVLFWLPLVHGLTRTLRKVTQATLKVAEGDFDVRVPDKRGDELGTLGRSVNAMAQRLAGYVTGQKRFLGDIAHELCSPIARMQVAVGIMEQHAVDPAQAPHVERMSRELAHMSDLVSELLSFSKASLGRDLELQPLKLAPLVQRAFEREAASDAKITITVPEQLMVVAEPDLLVRALANLIRNALRYAGPSGPIQILAVESGEEVQITLSDEGPGVPEEALPKVFDAFYRPDPARSRETGGAGLGLAIVKSCIDACHGTVTAHNRSPKGFEVVMRLINAG